jgi:hypothetical protein
VKRKENTWVSKELRTWLVIRMMRLSYLTEKLSDRVRRKRSRPITKRGSSV